jgi:hypothetical protein
MSAQEPTEEELREALKQMKVEDFILQSAVTLVNIAGGKLTAEGDAKDLEQGRLGIEAARALLPLCPQEQLGPVKDAVSQLQMIYVRETGGAGDAPPPPEPQQPEQPEQPEQEQPSRIWTPPGS